MIIKRCPFCGIDIMQRNELKPDAKKYDDLPFVTKYYHVFTNNCILDNFVFRSNQLEEWNKRIDEN